jgi:hypothetical protein
MIVLVAAAQDEGADDIHGQARRRNVKRIAIIHRAGPNEALDGFHRHAEARHAENDGARECRQVAELAGAEREAGTAGVTPRQPIGAGREPERAEPQKMVITRDVVTVPPVRKRWGSKFMRSLKTAGFVANSAMDPKAKPAAISTAMKTAVTPAASLARDSARSWPCPRNWWSCVHRPWSWISVI